MYFDRVTSQELLMIQFNSYFTLQMHLILSYKQCGCFALFKSMLINVIANNKTSIEKLISAKTALSINFLLSSKSSQTTDNTTFPSITNNIHQNGHFHCENYRKI